MVNFGSKVLSDEELHAWLLKDAGVAERGNAAVVKLPRYAEIREKVAEGSYDMLREFAELRSIGYSFGEAVNAEVDSWGGVVPGPGSQSDFVEFFRGLDPAQFS